MYFALELDRHLRAVDSTVASVVVHPGGALDSLTVTPASPCADRWCAALRGTSRPHRPGQARRRMARGPSGARPDRARRADVGTARLQPAWQAPT